MQVYIIDEKDFEILNNQILRKLYGDGTSLSPDDRRDIANLMQVILWRIRDNPVDIKE